MLRIGLTGGIAAGKSTASARFAELGARVIDHDALARRVVEPGSAALVDIVKEFGDRVLAHGALDRSALAAIVFDDDVAREKLNAIVHPYVRSASMAADRTARADGVEVIVHDIPLLVEAQMGDDFDLVVTIAASVPTRMDRLMSTRGMTKDEALGRIGAQASDESRAEIADVVLDGNGDADHLREQVDAFWAEHIPQGG